MEESILKCSEEKTQHESQLSGTEKSSILKDRHPVGGNNVSSYRRFLIPPLECVILQAGWNSAALQHRKIACYNHILIF